MTPIIILFFRWLAQLIIAFPLFASNIKANLKENKGKLPAPLKIMRLHILIASFFQVMMTLLLLSNKNNMLLVHIYVVEEFILDMLFYREILRKGAHRENEPTKRPIFITAIGIFAVFALVNAAFITDTNHFPIYTFAVQSIITVVCAIKYYYARSFDGDDPIANNEFDTFKLYKGPVFWMNMGKLIYFCFALPLFILYVMAMENKEQHTAVLLWGTQNIFLIILHIFMGIGFLKFTGDPSKVLDFMTRDRKMANKERRRRYIQDPDFAKRLKNDPDLLQAFMEDNPDLFG